MADDHLIVYEALLDAQKHGKQAALVTVITTTGSMPRHAGSKMLVYPDGSIRGTIGGGAMEAQAIALAIEAIQTGETEMATFSLNSLANGDPGICGGTADIFVEPLAVAPTLLIVGGGHVGKALAELGKWSGFRVVLSDDRPEYANEDYVTGLSRYLVCSPADITQHITIDANTYVAAVTRGLPVDEHLLPALLQTSAAYIGLIGSRRRWALTMKKLREDYNISEKALQRIHAPIGLELQAESPNEIAISIMAEVIMVRRGGTGEPMRWYGKEDELTDSSAN
jgi:xanthine dehydrogenase accessory factor